MVIAELAADLKQLRLEAGQPTFRAMAKASGAVSHTTLHDAVSGARLPTWPTVQAFVEACGGDSAVWRQRWLAASGAEQDQPQVAPQLPRQEPEQETTAAGSPAERGRRPRVSRISLLAAGLVGMAVGAGGALGISAWTQSAPSLLSPCQTSDAAAMAPPRALQASQVTDRESAVPKGVPVWVGRRASDQENFTGTAVVLPITTKVTSGDVLVVTVMLTSVCPGPVQVTDTLGDSYTMVADETDTARHRTMIFAAFGVKQLTTADAVHLSYPHAGKYHVAVDEFRNISAVTGSSHAHGEAGNGAFSTSANPVTCTRGDLMVAAIGTNTGTAPTLAAGWTTLPVLKLSSYRLTTAYQVAAESGRCAVTGTTTAQWGATLVTFH
ncbi:hypothetical protein ABIA32_006576 [Streptacidiphilus sp. MAP12-20]|uniref:helix-turn-helix domain-containing protein n=1 Tax=Streptacidiphilus sp. MAP12-20 TaxID=3156299 RepID=UPI0035127B6D